MSRWPLSISPSIPSITRALCSRSQATKAHSANARVDVPPALPHDCAKPSATPGLPGAELRQHLHSVSEVPMLGELPVFNSPDIDGPVREGLSGRRDASKRLGVGCRMGGACDHLVARNDAIVDLHPVVRRRDEGAAKILDLSGEAIRTPARVLDIGFGEELRKGARVVGVHRRHISVEKPGSNELGISFSRRAFPGREGGTCWRK